MCGEFCDSKDQVDLHQQKALFYVYKLGSSVVQIDVQYHKGPLSAD